MMMDSMVSKGKANEVVLSLCVYMCVDIAVSAPFHDGGKVFIYYGSNGETLINTTAQQVPCCCCCCLACVLLSCVQVITAEQMVAQVTNLTALKGFGFSLDGKVDVDGNQYRGE